MPNLTRTHAAQLTIDLGAICANWKMLRDKIGNAECSAVVKADAYGCGMNKVAPALSKAGCKTFFVAHLQEAIALRALLADAVIYVLNGLPKAAVAEYKNYNLRPVLGSVPEIEEWLGSSLPFALHMNTGMNRLGLQMQALDQLPLTIMPDLVMSHFISSEIHDDKHNFEQISFFNHARVRFPQSRFSMANSSGIFLKEAPFYDLVRPGYALYGGNPTQAAPNPVSNVVSLHAPVLQILNIKAGETVGYNAIWTAKRDSVLATLSLGYADGILRSASSTNAHEGGHVFWRDAAYPFVGRISMDLATIDMTDAAIPPLRGDAVEVIGKHMTIDAVATGMKTIGYEVLTSLGARYQRSYI